jgi:hypothetical protein
MLYIDKMASHGSNYTSYFVFYNIYNKLIDSPLQPFLGQLSQKKS